MRIVIAALGMVWIAAWLAGCQTVPPAPPLASCTEATAMPVAAEALDGHPDSYVHRCVRFTGVLAGRVIHDRIESVYRFPTDSRVPAIAAYGATTALDDALNTRARVEVVGLASSCAQIAHDAPSGSMILGGCHVLLGAAITVTKLTVLDAAPPRIVDPASPHAELAREDLAAVGADARAAIDAWFAAARAHDLAKMRTLVKYMPDDIHGLTVPPETALHVSYFRYRGKWPARDVACVCTQASCDGQWPIALLDIEPQAPWPYSCVVIAPDGHVDIYW